MNDGAHLLVTSGASPTWRGGSERMVGLGVDGHEMEPPEAEEAEEAEEAAEAAADRCKAAESGDSMALPPPLPPPCCDAGEANDAEAEPEGVDAADADAERGLPVRLLGADGPSA